MKKYAVDSAIQKIDFTTYGPHIDRPLALELSYRGLKVRNSFIIFIFLFEIVTFPEQPRSGFRFRKHLPLRKPNSNLNCFSPFESHLYFAFKSSKFNKKKSDLNG